MEKVKQKLKGFSTPKLLLVNFVAIIVVFFIVVIVFRVWLSSYTNHGESIEVPDFSNLTVSEAQTLAERNNIVLMVADTVFDESREGGVIVATKPSAGSFVKEDRTIYATLNSASPLLVRVPNLVNISLRQAQINIENAGLTLGTVEYVAGSAQDYVIDARYRNRPLTAGAKIPKRSAINLVVERGGAAGSYIAEYVVPNLIGKSYSEALHIISGLGASANAIFDTRLPYRTTADSLNAIVWKQIPPADSVSSQSVITIHLIRE
ncbi:MAG: PASTA domain-containing protein [Bacteroidales bacterium]|jgi:beta-lactam-binding protein with PASTA domain|nr:PASTA domain-containing protein [Bacteroidales bacterium]